MGLFSFLSKTKQDGTGEKAEFYSRAEGDAKPRSRKRSKESKVANADRAIDDEPLDPVLPEKKRARRRLVGAVALVLAMIIGLPMLLDSEPKPVADDIAIQIPSRDKPPAPDMTTAASTAASVAQTTAPANANPVASSGSVPASASLGPHEQIVNMPPAAKPAEQAAVADKPAAKPEKPADKPAEKVAEKVADKPTEKLQDRTQDRAQDKQTTKTEAKHDDKNEARAEAILEGKDAATKPAKDGKFVVQVAALTSKDKISELQGKLSDAGFKPMLQTVPTDAGPTTRVRVGPFASKEEAESARAKLAKLGLNGKLLPL